MTRILFDMFVSYMLFVKFVLLTNLKLISPAGKSIAHIPDKNHIINESISCYEVIINTLAVFF